MSDTVGKTGMVLIVDDVPDNIGVLGEILADEFTVKVATNGKRALNIAQTALPDIILLDIMMPEMDGYQVCAQLKRQPETKDIPVIFVTALSDVGHEERGFAAGCVDYLTKPIVPSVALSRIRTHLALRRAQRELELWNSSLQAQVLYDYERQKAQLALYSMDQASCNDLLDRALEESLLLTRSSFSSLLLYDEDTRLLTVYAADQKQAAYELDSTGLWGEAVRQRRAIITNDLSAIAPLGQGHIAGDVRLTRHLSLPIFSTNRIVAVVVVGDKPDDYTEEDARQLELFLNSAWNVVVRRKTEDELQEARRVAEESSRMKTQLMANLSHELRTPLNGVIGGAQLLRYTELTAEQEDYLQMIDESSVNELTLINNLLELVKMESDGVRVARALFSLRRCIDDAVQAHEAVARSKGVMIQQNLPMDLPVDVLGDKVRILQILHSLLGNAIKFTAQGTVTVSLACQPQGDGVLMACFSVTDTGVGIEREKLESIFELFIQSDMSNTRSYGGLGLGLSICKRLVTALDGRIWAESILGSGSSFYLELPLGLVPSAPELSLTDRPLKILLAEDDPLSSKIAETLLTKMGHQVVTAVNGKEAVLEWKKIQPDLILMDIQMPVMTGFEALQQIRCLEQALDKPRTTVVAQTAYTSWNSHESFSNGQFDGFLTKPLKKDELEPVLAAAGKLLTAL